MKREMIDITPRKQLVKETFDRIPSNRGWMDMKYAPRDGREFDIWTVDKKGNGGARIPDVRFSRLMGQEQVLCGRQNKVSDYLVVLYWQWPQEPPYIPQKNEERQETQPFAKTHAEVKRKTARGETLHNVTVTKRERFDGNVEPSEC
jgi:hypothetical protein